MLRNCGIEVECPTLVGGATVVAGPVRAPKPIRFGDDFEFDFSTYTLRRCGRALKLERIPLQVLLILIEQKGQLVNREEIAEKIEKSIFVFELKRFGNPSPGMLVYRIAGRKDRR